MVIELTGDIMQGLLKSPIVLNWVAKINNMPNVSANTTPSGQLPAVVVYETLNRDRDFADDEVFSFDVRYQITLFSENGSFSSVPNTIDTIMRSLDFTRDNLYTLYDKDTKIYQKIMLYRTSPTVD